MAEINKPIKDELNTKGKKINPFVSNGDTFRSADKTNYDLTNPNPAGGPINSPRYQYSHTYTPTNTYLNNFSEAASPNSAFGIQGDQVISNNIFEKTELDIEDPRPLGGPNRTNSTNIPNGSYTNNRSGNKFGESSGGPLRDKEGKIVNNFIQQYSSKNTYLNNLDGIINNQPTSKLPSQTLPPSPNIGQILSQIPRNIT